MGVHDGAGVVAAVDAQVQVELRGGRELAVDLPAVQVHDAHLLGLELGEHGAGGRDRHLVAAPGADVAGGAQHEPLGGQPPAGRRHLLALRRQASPAGW